MKFEEAPSYLNRIYYVAESQFIGLTSSGFIDVLDISDLKLL